MQVPFYSYRIPMYLPPETIIASGPVIIEDGKVLLNREIKESGITPWLFPGGKVEDFDISLEEACRREVQEEMGLDVEIIRALKPMMVMRPEEPQKMAILIHFLAKRIGEVNQGDEIHDWAWHDIDNLPEDCAPNIAPVIDDYKKTEGVN